MIQWWNTTFGERDVVRVSRAIYSRNISQGPVTREFEKRLGAVLGVPYVVCTTSGTTALTMALLAAGVGPGDEVIVPNRTWIATAHAVMMTGAKVRLADVDERGLLGTFNLHGKVRAIIPVHLNGRYLALAAEILGHLKRNDIAVIEDSCQAFPKPPAGDMTCYSFSTAKLLPTGQGGCVATRDESLYRELLSLRTHDVPDAMDPAPIRWRRFGYNFRYNDILASIGLAQLDRLDERIARLHEIRKLYAEGLPGYLELLPCEGVPLYSEVLYADSERLLAHLLHHDIQARPNYPGLNTAPYLNDNREFPASERFTHGLTLPSGPAQTNADIHRVIDTLRVYPG